MKEFEIIDRHFRFRAGKGVRIGVGDDAAIVEPAGLLPLAVSTDSLVENVHFLPGVSAELLGRKSLSASLSDMAAMGAAPLYATAALIHPNPRPEWLESFAQGLAQVADEHGMSVVGGDLTHGGAVAVNVTVIGRSSDRPLLRTGLAAGDRLWATGYPGEALLGLAALKGELGADGTGRSEQAVGRHQNPVPRVEFGLQVAELASAAIDTSDGLWKSLELLASASGLRLEVDLDCIPLSKELQETPDPLSYVLGASDDYELLVGVPPSGRTDIEAIALGTGTPVAEIGSVSAGVGVRLLRKGRDVTGEVAVGGYEHWG